MPEQDINLGYSNYYLGYTTKVKELINAIKNGVSPFIRHGDNTILIEVTNQHMGYIVYTLFDSEGIGVHTVHVVFSFRDTLFDILDRGENRTKKLDPLYPTIIQVPTDLFVDEPTEPCYNSNTTI